MLNEDEYIYEKSKNVILVTLNRRLQQDLHVFVFKTKGQRHVEHGMLLLGYSNKDYCLQHYLKNKYDYTITNVDIVIADKKLKYLIS